MSLRGTIRDRRAFGAPGGPVPKTRLVISIVDDDESVREAAKGLMKSLGYNAETFASAEDFLRSRQLTRTACLIADINMPGMSGIDLHPLGAVVRRSLTPFHFKAGRAGGVYPRECAWGKPSRRAKIQPC